MMDDMWSRIDFDHTIKDFEFTKRAMNEIYKVVYSADFEDMDANMIFSYLKEKMELVSFRDYLKRYLYSAAGIKDSFYSVDDAVYRDIIMTSFDDTFTPHSMEPTTKRWSAIVKGWLNSDSVRRQTIFLLGFGLSMSDRDVSEFLTKVNKEEDFNPLSWQEVIFYYCYKNHLPWSFASKKMEWYKTAEMDTECPANTDLQHENVKMPQLSDEQQLDQYLLSLKKTSSDQEEDITYRIFETLIAQAKDTIVNIYQEDSELGKDRHWIRDDITSSDIEKIICCGIPVTSNGNLQKMSASLLNKHFNQKRISRQRLDKLLHRQLNVDRFDLITLLFFIYSQKMAEEEPEIRCMQYIDEINDLLGQCHMSGLYAVNAYEAFILMCLLSESPLSTYSEIWEMSYSEG